MRYMPSPLPNFITRTILGKEYRSLSSSLCNLLHSPVTSSLLGLNILLSTLFSNTLSLHSSLNVSDQVSSVLLIDNNYNNFKQTENLAFSYLIKCFQFNHLVLNTEKKNILKLTPINSLYAPLTIEYVNKLIEEKINTKF